MESEVGIHEAIHLVAPVRLSHCLQMLK